MTKVTINPSIAALIDIDGVGYAEEVEIYFEGTQNWTGSYVFKVWNSFQKNTEKTIPNPNPLTVLNKIITLALKPTVQTLVSVPDGYYYEIISVETKRIVFKGSLFINK